LSFTYTDYIYIIEKQIHFTLVAHVPTVVND
jgi:hypothetical protein